MDNYFKELGMIYENLDMESSYDDYDAPTEKVKAEAHELCSYIENYLKGTINFYQNNKKAFFNNPSDMNSFEELKGMFERIRPTLAQYSQFGRN
jgi:hypothetical protein